VDLFGVRTLPLRARRNYVYELDHTLLWSVLAGLLEGQFAAVVVAKTLHGSEAQIAVATATPTAAYLFSLVWGMLCVGRPKIRLATLFGAGAVLCAGAVGAIPETPMGTYWFVAQIAAAQVLLAGMVTVRSAIWKSNYPHEVRGRVTARLQSIRFIIGVLITLTAARLGDRNPSSYAYIYPLAALSGLISLFLLSRIRIRGEKGDLGKWQVSTLLSPRRIFGEMYSVLRDDGRFRQYCLAQMFTGISNLMTISIVVAIVTRDLVPGDARGFWISVVLLDALPKMVMLGSIGRWGHIFDRLGVLAMREVNLLCWAASITFAMLGDLFTPAPHETTSLLFLLGVTFFVLRGIATGLGQGGGAVAWYIGHLHFARPEDAEVYMGIHVFLTGLRGLIAPLAGMWLWQAIGWPVWLIAIGFSLASYRLYSRMAHDEERAKGSPSVQDAPAPCP